MLKLVHLITCCILLNITHAQLKCKKTIDKQKNKSTTCFHINGKISTVEIWDSIKREGKFIAYNNQGNEIVNYIVRRFAGHASVFAEYYKNGQIKKAEYSSAPDGGIQFWHIIHKFSEAGVQTEYYDYSQPNGYPKLKLN